MRILDCFSYFNEEELLELRINLLHDFVDKIIITDADHTHKGHKKPFTCKDTLKKLGLISNKIQVIEVNLPSYEEEPNAWVRERMQRDIASNFIEENDFAIISDCDEIINPNYINSCISCTENNLDNIVRIPMVFLSGRADLRIYDSNQKPRIWGPAFFCNKYHLQKYTLSQIREDFSFEHPEYSSICISEDGKIVNCGWHFSWMGDESRIQTKCESYAHWNEISIEKNYAPEQNSTDCLGRKDHILKKYSINLLPEKIFELDNVVKFLFYSSSDPVKEKYSHLFV